MEHLFITPTGRLRERERTLLNKIDETLEKIEEGEFVGIVGASGSGKTTLMNLLGCLDRPTYGSYRLNGTDVAGLDDDQLAKVRNHSIGFVFQKRA